MTRRLLAFDSGIGGLSVVGALQAQLPEARIDYLADNALYPYGELAEAVLVARVEALIGAALERFRPDAVVIACNTASTVVLAPLRARFEVPFIGCVPPIKWAASVSRTRHIGLLATAGTVRRDYLRDLQQRFAPDCTLVAHGARGLADIAEAAFRGVPVDRPTLRAELSHLFDQPGGDAIDVVGIGCTHYSVLLDDLRAVSPPGITWLDPAPAVARQAQSVLECLPQPGTGRQPGSWRADALAPEGRGRAWFTALPDTPERMRVGLARFGYERIERFELQPEALDVETGRALPAHAGQDRCP